MNPPWTCWRRRPAFHESIGSGVPTSTEITPPLPDAPSPLRRRPRSPTSLRLLPTPVALRGGRDRRRWGRGGR